MEGKMESLKSIEKPMLLLSGTKSQTFLLQSIRDVKGVLPQAKHVEFTGLDHSGAWNASRGGSPAVVAEALREFFA
jgi:pimeloyl-ACP methyl ester carboxylesterase